MVVGQSSVTMFRYSLDTSKTDQTLVQKSEASSRRGQLELMRLHRREAEAETFRPPLLPLPSYHLLPLLIISSSSSSSSPPCTTSLPLPQDNVSILLHKPFGLRKKTYMP